MARTALFRRLRRWFRVASGGVENTQTGPSRRTFIEALAALAVIPVIGPTVVGASGCGDDDGGSAGGKDVAIVGGGIAGLTAAHFLKQAGITATVYEASMRSGGRMYTQKMLAGDQICELGGELVDSNHMVVPALCEVFGLHLDDLVTATPGLAQDQFHFQGAFLTEAQLVTAFMPVAAKMQMAITMGEADDAEFERIDALNLSQWLEQEAGLAAGTLMRGLLETAYLEEYGLEVVEQSAWNMLYLIDSATAEPFRIFGESDERFHIHEGSGSLPDAIAADLGDQVELDHKLASVAAAGAKFTLAFATAGGPVTATVDRVVYALPFTKLREVDLDAAGLSAAKRTIIDEIGYGMNAKLMMQFSDRPWETNHQSSGSLITDLAAGANQLQTTWATSRGQAGAQGILTNFVGGTRGVTFNSVTPEQQAATVLPLVEIAYPSTSASYLAGSAIVQHWPSYEFNKGSYACYKVGQWAFNGGEGTQEGHQHFCGEHTSIDFQGYMEGGAATGARVAIEILNDLGIELPAMLAALVAVVVPTDARVVTGKVNPLRMRRAKRARAAGARVALIAAASSR